jgi:hypothetical protein
MRRHVGCGLSIPMNDFQLTAVVDPVLFIHLAQCVILNLA